MHQLAEALEDYNKVIELAPLADDAWVAYLNRGSTLLALEKAQEALGDLQASAATLFARPQSPSAPAIACPPQPPPF